MNKVILMGRLTRDPELSYASNGDQTAYARFSLAINRRGRDEQADFVNITAFGKTAEFVSKYFVKGQMMALTGRLQVNSYQDKEGNKRTSTSVLADEVFFTGGKSENPSTPNIGANPEGFYPSDDGISDDDLPF